MSDPRDTPPADRIVLNEAARVAVPLVDLTRGPEGPRDRQLLYGDAVTILNRSATHCLIRAAKDGYCGTVPGASLASPRAPTHRVTARATHAYTAPDIKSPDRVRLCFGAQVTALSESATFIETDLGFIPRQHLHRAEVRAADPAAVAEIFLGTPYLWGGNSSLGIDCSGLVQAACLACGIACPGDSDQQAARLGTTLPDDAPLQRNDLIFWKGHVALVRGADLLIHANAGHMAVVHEPIDAAIERIRTQGDGLPTRRKRLPPA
jgi:cell wall-associated NlpC family hydrolase